jgi:predicted dithiol-disulfide oxidoreductase (DUF899 family)
MRASSERLLARIGRACRSRQRPSTGRSSSACASWIDPRSNRFTATLDKSFTRHGETIRHFWGSELFYAPVDAGQDPRHVGTLEPVWNLFDLTPEGRPADWDEQLHYA